MCENPGWVGLPLGAISAAQDTGSGHPHRFRLTGAGTEVEGCSLPRILGCRLAELGVETTCFDSTCSRPRGLSRSTSGR